MPLSTTSAGFQIDSVCVDRFRLDGGAMFGVIPKALWHRTCPADEANRIAMGCQSLVLRRENRVILIDAGLGDKWDPKSRQIYAIGEGKAGRSPLVEALGTLDIAATDVTDVIVTHLHFDHAGGLTHFDQEGALACTFPNARHWVQAEHLDWARSPTEKDRGSFPSENIEPIAQADLFSLCRGDEELFSGLSLITFNGHTRAMQGVLIDGESPLFFPADLLPMKAHLHLPFIMAYDIEPLTTLAEKKQVLARAVKEKWLLYLEHEPEEAIGRVEMFGGKYRLGTA